MISEFVLSAFTVFLFMLFMYLLSRVLKNNSIVDIGWGIGFMVSLIFLFIFSDYSASRIILGGMILIWGSRLSIHIYQRNKGKPEDFRYANWRKEWGRKEPLIAFFKVYMLQGLVMYLCLVPIVIFFRKEPTALNGWNLAGGLVFLTGLLIESFADTQMKNFKKNKSNQGKIIQNGLWKYSRHPNYFGEALIWWGVWIFTLGHPCSPAGVISPVLISFLLRFVSGVPMLEEKYLEKKEFIEYARKTPVFIPFIGKKLK